MTDHLDPTRAQFEAFKDLPRNTPIMMLNLIRFKKQASYEDGREISGRAAYEIYGEQSAPIFGKLGGEIIWRGEPQSVLIGSQDEHWDMAFIARYPNASAFLAMVTDPDYKLLVKHRQAAVADSRLIRMGDLASGSGFAG